MVVGLMVAVLLVFVKSSIEREGVDARCE